MGKFPCSSMGHCQPLFEDPLGNILNSGIDIGLLGIELHTRRRNRLNGIVTNVSTDRFEVAVRHPDRLLALRVDRLCQIMLTLTTQLRHLQ
jgi:hypothetical protein